MGEKIDKAEIKVPCECGEILHVDFGKWKINIVGLIEFRCPRCSKVYRTKGLWESTVK